MDAAKICAQQNIQKINNDSCGTKLCKNQLQKTFSRNFSQYFTISPSIKDLNSVLFTEAISLKETKLCLKVSNSSNAT